MTDTRFGPLTSLQVYGDPANMPECGIKVGRKDDNEAANQLHFYQVGTAGYFKVAGVLNVASEEFTNIGGSFHNSNTGDTYAYFADAFNSAEWGRPKIISAITRANQAVLTITGHGFVGGETVMVTKADKITQGAGSDSINNLLFLVVVVDANRIKLQFPTTLAFVNTNSSMDPYTANSGSLFIQLYSSDFVITALSPWAENSFKQQTHIAASFSCVEGRAAIYEGVDSFHWYQQCHMTCGAYDAPGAMSTLISSVSSASPLVVTANGHGLSDDDLVFIDGVEGMGDNINARLYFVAAATANTFQLKDLYGVVIDSSTWGMAISNTGKVTEQWTAGTAGVNGGYGMRMVVGAGGSQQSEYHIHHEPGSGANGVVAWATVESMEKLRDPSIPAVAVLLEDVTFRENAAHSQKGLILADTATVASVTMHAGGVRVGHFRDRFGGASITDKLLIPANIWSLRGVDLILEQAAATPGALAAFSGRYYVELPSPGTYLNQPEALTVASAAPELRLSETDKTDPAGRFRLLLDTDVLKLQRAAAPNWGSASDIVSVDGPTLLFTIKQNLTVTGSWAKVSAGSPELRLEETGQTAPAGQYRLFVAADTAKFQRGFPSGSDIWTVGSSRAVDFAVKPNAPKYQVGNTDVVGARKTGWAAATGTADRTAFATYAAPTIGNPPTQAEVQAVANHVQVLSRHLKALEDDLIAHGLIGA